ncbi:MAG: Crp/Fnr family transcriptional regulator [Nitrosomonas ureae]
MLTNTSYTFQENSILGALTAAELDSLAPHLELVTLLHSEVLFEDKDMLQYVYFPVTATVSLLCCLEDGSCVEVAMVGNEGIIGISVVLGNNAKTLTQAITKIEGQAYRISVRELKNILARSGGRRAGTLKKLLLRYAQTLFVQISQATACNRRHALEQQLCTWLLSCFDRGNSSNLSITQELIAYILGVRRESITVIAKKLQEEGMINYSRGQIQLKCREKLEIHACECYSIVKNESDRWVIDAKAA